MKYMVSNNSDNPQPPIDVQKINPSYLLATSCLGEVTSNDVIVSYNASSPLAFLYLYSPLGHLIYC